MNYYYIYSAMTQATGGLIALVGVFIIFRIQIQRERIQKAYDVLELLAIKARPTSLRFCSNIEIENEVKRQLKVPRYSEEARRLEALEREWNNLERHKDILAYTIKIGICTILLLSILFGFFIFSLYFKLLHNIWFLMLGLMFAIITLWFMVRFLIRTIIVEWDEYLDPKEGIFMNIKKLRKFIAKPRQIVSNFVEWCKQRKKMLTYAAIFFTMISILITAYSNTSKGRKIYIGLFERELATGIDGLLQPPNYYIRPNAKPKICGGWNFFTLEKDAEGFERIKNFIATYHYKKGGGYPVKFIIQYQTAGIGDDHQIPVFRECVIFFIPDKEEYTDIDINSLKVIERDELFKLVSRFKWITTQDAFTQDVNTYLTNRIVQKAFWILLFPAILLNLFVCYLRNDKQR